jgi:tetratricopeptide (TPR) repeat protein
METPMKIKLFLFSLSVLVLSSVVFGQLGIGNGRIKGSVKDEAGKALAGAKVLITNRTYKNTFTSYSDEKGQWSVAGIASGWYEFRVTMEGFPEVKSEMNVSFKNQLTQTLDVTLKKVQDLPKNAPISKNNAFAVFVNEGNELYRQKQFGESAAKYEQALKTNPSEYSVNINLGNCYLEMKEYDKAVDAYQKYLAGIKADKGSWNGQADAARVLSMIGRIYLDQNSIDKAKEYFKLAIDAFPNDEIIPYNLGEILFNQGQAEQAIEYLKIAIKLKESWAPPYLKLGYAYLNRGEYKFALESMKKFVELAPDDPQAPTVRKLIPQLEELAKKK